MVNADTRSMKMNAILVHPHLMDWMKVRNWQDHLCGQQLLKGAPMCVCVCACVYVCVCICMYAAIILVSQNQSETPIKLLTPFGMSYQP
jgi:hypothetical protein